MSKRQSRVGVIGTMSQTKYVGLDVPEFHSRGPRDNIPEKMYRGVDVLGKCPKDTVPEKVSPT